MNNNVFLSSVRKSDNYREMYVIIKKLNLSETVFESDIAGSDFVCRKLVLEENKMAKNERFKKVYSQGAVTGTEIWVDKETGVNYVFHFSGYAGGLTPLLDKDGKPVVTPIED